MRASKYKIKDERRCRICKEKFEPTSSGQYVCNSDHPKTCEYCGLDYIVITQKHLRSDNAYCDNICSTFSQTNSTIDRGKIAQYKDTTTWAKQFKKLHDRKPTEADFRVYFNVRRLPRNYDRSLFLKKPDSRFELIIIDFIRNKYPDLQIKRRHRNKFDNGWLEIDIYLPELSFGVEVQDFKTHSKDSDHEPDPFGGLKKGPKYHQTKIDTYREIAVEVIEVWEDEIIDGRFKEEIEGKIKGLLSLK